MIFPENIYNIFEIQAYFLYNKDSGQSWSEIRGTK